jgi:hypothetical protein
LKAFCLAFAFLLVALPASAEELPQTSNAWRANEAGIAEPGSFKWTVVDDATGQARAPANAVDPDAESKNAPARAALAQIRAETRRVMDDAHKSGVKVSRIRYDLRVRCLVEEVELEAQTASIQDDGSMPYIWGVKSEDDTPETGIAEVCEVDYSQKVRAQADPDAGAPGEVAPAHAPVQPQMNEYKVAFPVD